MGFGDHRRHAFSFRTVVALLLTATICAVFWSQIAILVLRLA